MSEEENNNNNNNNNAVIPQGTTVELDANVVYNAAVIISHATQRGTFQASELTTVGTTYDKLIEVVKEVAVVKGDDVQLNNNNDE